MMRVTTLKGRDGAVGAMLDYYCGLAEDKASNQARGPVDYYLDPEEPPGRWWGDGCRALGVGGDVRAPDLRSVLEGHHPDTGRRLGRSFGTGSVRGFDATFSAPKSVSALWALTPDPWVRAEVLAAHDHAVSAALGWLERHGCVTRRGRDGIDQVDAQGLAVSVFRQHTSRTMDPQLHSHALVTAKVQDATGRWLSLDARFLKYQQRTIGWVYDAALRTELTHRLGLDWGDVVGGQADLPAVPDRVLKEFSQRSDQVTALRDDLVRRWMVDNDNNEPDPRTIAKIERAAVRASRPVKTTGHDPALLHAQWGERASEAGFDPQRLQAERLAVVRVPAEIDDRAIAQEALGRVVEESSTWLRADLARHVATLLPPDALASAAALIDTVDRITDLATRQCIELSPDRDGPLRRDGRPVGEHVTDRRLTTKTVLGQERALQLYALHHASPTESGDDPQAIAAEAMAGGSSFVLVVGPAGTGKTRTTALAVQRLQRQGRPVIGLAPSGKAADVLRSEAGCETDTLAGFLTRERTRPWPRPIASGTTIVLDEAGMANTADLAELVHLAQRNHWRLVAIGDPAQLPAVGRGGVFAHWCNTIHHHQLDTPRRFLDAWEAQATLDLRAGTPGAVDQYDRHGRLHSTHPALLPHRVAVAHHEYIQAGRSVAITTASQTTASDINQAIQDAAGHAPDEPVARIRGEERAYIGDRIATRRNDRSIDTDQGHSVRNRQVWTVDAIHNDGSMVVSDSDRGLVTLPADYAEQHVELGWATTGYGSQGDTVDIGLAVIEPGTTRNHAYVALTRGREANHAWAPDLDGDTLPAQALEAALARTDDHTSALATRDRLHHQAGLPSPGLIVELDAGVGIGGL